MLEYRGLTVSPFSFFFFRKLYFLSQSPDGNFDSSRIHTLEIEGQHQLYTMICSPDPGFGVPCARKQAAIDSVAGSGKNFNEFAIYGLSKVFISTHL